MHLSETEEQLINQIKAQLSFVADVSRAEGLLYGPIINGQTTVLAHYHPHSVAPAYLKSYVDYKVGESDMPAVIKTLTSGRKQKGPQGTFGDGAKVAIEVWPVHSPDDSRRVIGAISIDTSLIEHERHRRRNKVFKKVLRQLQYMLITGRLKNVEILSPFGEYEGIMIVSRDGNILYTSGVAANLYRRIGYLDDLIGRNLEKLRTQDNKLFRQALESAASIEKETRDGPRYWVRKIIPLLPQSRPGDSIRRLFRPQKTQRPFSAVLIILHDMTEERRAEQEMRVKNAMIQEIHHRVKNNLQTISALLRIQSRRVNNEAAASALQDAVNRIMSVAVIHEFLSDSDAWTINIKEVCQRIIVQTKAGIVWPESSIRFELNGPSIMLPARQATACALVINELLQNSLEHGFDHHKSGTISITLEDEGDEVIITIHDDGQGLPDNFDTSTFNSLGLQIANTLVTEDLQGSLSFINNKGATATIKIPKAIFGGEEGWNENES